MSDDYRELRDSIAIVDTIITYMNNVSYDEIFGVAYGETETFKHHDSYREEKLGVMTNKHLVGLWPMLDGGGRHRLVKAAMAKYHEECCANVAHNAEKAEEEKLN